MHTYQCHKKVLAAKIDAIEFDAMLNMATIALRGGQIITASDYRPKFKGNEDDLGYYVLYEDGYASWSPTKAFEAGYTKVDA